MHLFSELHIFRLAVAMQQYSMCMCAKLSLLECNKLEETEVKLATANVWKVNQVMRKSSNVSDSLLNPVASSKQFSKSLSIVWRSLAIDQSKCILRTLSVFRRMQRVWCATFATMNSTGNGDCNLTCNLIKCKQMNSAYACDQIPPGYFIGLEWSSIDRSYWQCLTSRTQSVKCCLYFTLLLCWRLLLFFFLFPLSALLTYLYFTAEKSWAVFFSLSEQLFVLLASLCPNWCILK